MKLTRTVSILIALAAAAAMASPAAAYIYAGKRKKINCGIVYVRGASQPVDAGLNAYGYPLDNGKVGDLFYLLDQRVDLKPAGWSLENPLAPGSSAGVAGQPSLRKLDPAYWRIDLSAVRDLSRMHVLYLPASGVVNLDDQDREKLRRFVDGGGVLWIDNAGGTGTQLDFNDTFFIRNFKFRNLTGSDVPSSRHHPLLTLPFWLGDSEVGMIGANWGKSACEPGYDPSQSGWGDTKPVLYDILHAVTVNMPAGSGTSLPSIAANHYGSGRIVATSNFAGRGCYLNYPFSTPSTKFAFNVLAWASSWTHLRKDPRHSGNSIDTVGGTKLIKMWTLPVAPTAKDSAPIIYKNIAFYSSGSTLFAVDIMPQEDIDQDGNPDDGLQGIPAALDQSAAAGIDVIWIWPGPMQQPDGELSAPSLVTAHDPNVPSASIEAILVMSSSGNVHMLQAFPTAPNGFQLADSTSEIAPFPFSMGAPIAKPSPPVYANGWVFAMNGNGQMTGFSPSIAAWMKQNETTGEPFWQVPGAMYNLKAEPRSGPIYGFVKNDTTGAVIGMLYWFAGPSHGAVPDQEQNDYTYGVPVFVSNDRMKVERTDSTGLNLEFHIAVRDAYMSDDTGPENFKVQGSGLGINVTAVYPNTRLQSLAAPGNDRGHVVLTVSAIPPPDAVFYGTYALDYAKRQINYEPNTRLKVPLEPRSNATNDVPPTKVVGMPAMGANGMIYLNGGDRGSSAGGSVYGLQNDGTTQATRWNYLLHGGLSATATVGASGAGIPIPGVFLCTSVPAGKEADPVWAYGQAMASPQSCGSPAVSGGKVFVSVSGSGGPGPQAALACFKAESDFVIRVTESGGYDPAGRQVKKPKRLINETTGREMPVKIWQPSLLGSAPTGVQVTPLIGAIPVPRDMIDHDRGIISFKNFDRLKLKGGVGNVMMTNTFSPSLPVWVFVDNIEVPIDFNTWAPTKAVSSIQGMPLPEADHTSVDLGGWNNLLWYYLVPPHTGPGGAEVPCSGVHSSPVVIGNSVYFVCDDGYLIVLPAETGENSGGQIKHDSATWQIKTSGGGAPQDVSVSPAGSNGVLLVPSADGLHAYTNATTLVADGNRISEIDGAGEVAWSVDNLTWPAAIPPDTNTAPAVASGPVNKPSRVRYTEMGDVLVVNSGANQVCKMDKSGTVGFSGTKVGAANGPIGYIRWVWDKFADPKNLLRPGQPTSLRSPTDAIFWQEFESSYMVYHCLVADSGNHRVLDLVYRVKLDNKGTPQYLDAKAPVDPSTGFHLPELNWVTVTDSMNELYTYECLQLVPNISNNVVVGHDVWAAVSNYRTGTSATTPPALSQSLGGAVVALGYRTRQSMGSAWNYAGAKSGQIVAALDRVNWGGERPLANPRYFQVIDVPSAMPGTGGRYLVICDNYGVYEVGPLGSTVPQVRRSLTDEDYRQMPRTLIDHSTNKSQDSCGALGVPFVASSVQILPNGNWLITNSYAGSDQSALRVFGGEVFELDWSAGPKIAWNAPTLYVNGPCGGGTLPAGSWKQKMERSYLLQQPRCAFRQP